MLAARTLTKEALRATALAARGQMSAAERESASKAAAARLLPLIRAGETVSLFWPIRDEIDPRALVGAVLEAKGRVALPVVENRRIHFRAFDGEACLEDGAFGTRHPDSTQARLDPDLIVAPLAAFDRHGGRIGYGAGHYDHAIAELRAHGLEPRLVGIGFACQEVAAIPLEPHDVRLQMIATERALVMAEAA